MPGAQVRPLIREDPHAPGTKSVLRNKGSHRIEKPIHHNEQQPTHDNQGVESNYSLAATRESLRTAMKTQHGQKQRKS